MIVCFPLPVGKPCVCAGESCQLTCVSTRIPPSCFSTAMHGPSYQFHILNFKAVTYRKPTLTDLHLQWDSHHHLSTKFSVINTLRHRARTVCFNHQLLKGEEDHLSRALSNCKYPTWALNRANCTNKNNNRTNKNKNNKNSIMKNKPYIVVPYMKRLSESCKNLCKNMA